MLIIEVGSYLESPLTVISLVTFPSLAISAALASTVFFFIRGVDGALEGNLSVLRNDFYIVSVS